MANKMQIWGMVFFAFIIPTLALFAPLGITPAFIIMAIYPTFLFIKQGNIKMIWKNSDVNKVIIILLAYSLISSLWAIRPNESVNLWLRMSLMFLGSLGLFAYVPIMTDKEKILKALLCGVVLAIIIANIEIFTGGYIISLVRPFRDDYIVEMNRGSTILSIMSWAAIYYLLIQKNYKYALLLCMAVLITIARLESFSTVLGFVGGAVILPIIYYKREKALKIFAILAVLGIFVVATAAFVMDAHKLVGNVPVVPGAASDIRLYIWDYTAKQAMKKPLLGWGLNASRSYPVQQSDYVQGGRSPLPLHPHNNTLQVWLELGIVGLVMFATLLYTVLIRISKTVREPYMMACCTALFANYFLIGQTAYGMCQNWLVGGIILATTFLLLGRNYKTSEFK